MGNCIFGNKSTRKRHKKHTPLYHHKGVQIIRGGLAHAAGKNEVSCPVNVVDRADHDFALS